MNDDEVAEYRAEAAGSAAVEQAAARLEHLLAQRPAVYAKQWPVPVDVTWWARCLAEDALGGTRGILDAAYLSGNEDEMPDGAPLNLWLAGPYGTGKTYLTWAVAEAAVRGGYRGRVAFVKAAEFQDRCAPGSNGGTDWAWLRGIGRAGLLIVDDLGSQRLSDWDRDRLGPVVDERWEQQRPTVITTNDKNLKAMVGDRMADRLASSILLVALTGESHRRQA